MANYTTPRNPDHDAYHKQIFGDLANGSADGRNDPLVGWRLYRVVGVITATGVLTLIAPSAGNISVNVTLEGDTSQEVNLNTAFPNYAFPANVLRGPAYLRVRTTVAPATTPVIEFGDDDTDGLLTSSGLTTAAYVSTVAAAEYASRVEAAFVPTFVIGTSAGNLDDVTAGAFEIGIFYSPLPV